MLMTHRLPAEDESDAVSLYCRARELSHQGGLMAALESRCPWSGTARGCVPNATLSPDHYVLPETREVPGNREQRGPLLDMVQEIWGQREV
ncbi:hypothetical protein DPEC_G00297460 [Dallia pectoralis]|uniref:Uncharacterized protein n=1 Tax=Dallia pectoralis TaxID=75939 RepID=A0ACC2FFS0_DALPE|nr:hypothetical protein DPEC_G00297460 [Dallia pectoralis]